MTNFSMDDISAALPHVDLVDFVAWARALNASWPQSMPDFLALASAFSSFNETFPTTDWPEFRLDYTEQELCQSALVVVKRSGSWFANRPRLVLLLIFVWLELLRYFWHRIRLVALNFRRYTPPSPSYSAKVSLDQHEAFLERLFCDRTDLKECLEGLFQKRFQLHEISREMMQEALMAHMAMEVRRWYPKAHHDSAERLLQRIEERLEPLGLQDSSARPNRVRTCSGGSFATPLPFDAHPEAARQPFLYIGEQRLSAYFKPFPVQMAIWCAKFAKRVLLKRWGFRWRDLGPVQMWIREPERTPKAEQEPPLLFCPGLFLGNTAYLAWIKVALLPLQETRPLLLLEMPHISHGIDPRQLAYALRYSWPRSDEVADAVATVLHSFGCRTRPADIVGNSFGTVLMTYMRKEHKDLFRRWIYIDPVNFPPCFPGPNVAANAPYLDSYLALLREALRLGGGWPKPALLFKFLILRPAIFGDLGIQYVLKRGLYAHEGHEFGTLDAESLVIIGKKDELLSDPAALAEWLWRTSRASVEVLDYNHGVVMGKPEPFAKLFWSFLAENGTRAK